MRIIDRIQSLLKSPPNYGRRPESGNRDIGLAVVRDQQRILEFLPAFFGTDSGQNHNRNKDG